VGSNFVTVCGWNPASRILAAEDEQSVLWLISLDAQMRPLAGASVPVPNSGQAAWSPDGSRLIYTSLENGESRIMLGDEHGNSSTPILATTVGRARKPVWSFDGAHVAYTLETASDGETASEIHVLSVGELAEDKLVYRSDPSVLTEGAVVVNGFTPDGSAVVFSLGSPQAPSVFKVPVNGGAPEPVKARAALFSYSGGLPTMRYRSLKVFLQDLFATFEAEDLGRLTELCLPVLERVDASGKSKEELWGDKRADALLRMIRYVGPSGVAQASQTPYSGGDGRFEHVVVLGGSGRKLFLSRGDGRWYVAGFYLTD
jgi:dipeptidyl aminopeptidase/acylaminoacyl peptidase